jgi:polar amino acid transport system substrate-binding protein
MALTNTDTCVFVTTRTPEREALFKWVGPLGSADWILYAAADRNLKLSSLSDAMPLLIGTYGGDVRDDFFRSRGFKVESVPDDSSNPKKLLLHRIDLWAASRNKAVLFISQNGWADKITPVLTFHKVDLYLACNLAVPDALILQLNSALEAMNKDGTSNAIEKKYAN